MKKLIPFLLISLSFWSCKKTKELLDIPFNYTSKSQITLPKTGEEEREVPPIEVPIKTPDQANSAPEEFKKRNVNINKIKSVVVEGMNFNIQSPEGQTFGFIKSVKVFLGAAGKGEVLIAARDNIHTITPAPTNLSLITTNNNVAEYMTVPSYYFKIHIAAVRTYTQDIVVGTEVKFKVVANPLR